MARGERVPLSVADPRSEPAEPDHEVLAPPHATIRALLTRLDAQGAWR